MSSIRARSAYGLRSAAFVNGESRFRMKNPSPGSCFGGFERPGEGTVPIDAALTTTMRRTSVACIAWTMARVPCEAIPASEFDRGPRPERTASAPSTADSSTTGSAAARSAVTMRTSPESFFGLRTTAVTSWPAAAACSRTCRPIPPVAAKIVSFICCSLLMLLVRRRRRGRRPLGVGARGAAEDLLYLACEGRRLPVAPGVPGLQGLDERLGETALDHALLDRLRRDLLITRRPADHVADDGDHLLVGEGLRARQLEPSANQFIGEQRAGAHPGHIPFVDRRFGEGRVQAANDVTGADLGAPREEGVGGEGVGPQADPLQAASDGGVLDLLVPVPVVPGWLLGEVVVDVERRHGHRPLHPWFAGECQWLSPRLLASVSLSTERFQRTMTLMMATGTSSPSTATRTHGETSAPEPTRSQRPIATVTAMPAQSPVSTALRRSSARTWNPVAMRTMMARPTAASGVSHGRTPVAMGSTRPAAPRTSAKPMKTT